MEMHWATVWESIADTVPDAPATTNGDTTISWATDDEKVATTEDAMMGSVKSELAYDKAPKRVIFVPMAPRAPNGMADDQTARAFADQTTG